MPRCQAWTWVGPLAWLPAVTPTMDAGDGGSPILPLLRDEKHVQKEASLCVALGTQAWGFWKGRDGTLPGGRPRAWECSPCREGGHSPHPALGLRCSLLVEGGLRNWLGRARASHAPLLRRGALQGLYIMSLGVHRRPFPVRGLGYIYGWQRSVWKGWVRLTCLTPGTPCPLILSP